jgi:hypothetical protein
MSSSPPFGFPASDGGAAANPFALPAPASRKARTRWSDVAWLDGLRTHADPAGEAVARALKPLGAGPTRAAFSAFRSGERRFPAGTPEVLLDFAREAFAYSDRDGFVVLPTWADRQRIIRGQRVFMTTAVPAVLVMLCKALTEGYAAPSMAKVLNLSGDLSAYPKHRLMGTLQLLLNVSTPGSFEPGGAGIVSGLEMRLLHAGVRANVAPAVMGAEKLAEFRATYGEPINQEDMIGTILGFSLLVIDGLRALGLGWTDEQAEDYYHLWSVFAHLMGVRTPGVADDANAMPGTLDEARTFYAAYHRHYVGATDFSPGFRERSIQANRDGVQLTDAHIGMLNGYVPLLLRELVHDEIVRAYIHLLIGDAACARIGMQPGRHVHLLEKELRTLPWMLERVLGHTSEHMHVALAELLFGSLVHHTFPQGVVFPTPTTVADLKELTLKGD